MAKYHVNPETGKPNQCNAQTPEACLYYNAETRTEAPHFSSEPEARKYVENMLSNEYNDNGKRKNQIENLTETIHKGLYFSTSPYITNEEFTEALEIVGKLFKHEYSNPIEEKSSKNYANKIFKNLTNHHGLDKNAVEKLSKKSSPTLKRKFAFDKDTHPILRFSSQKRIVDTVDDSDIVFKGARVPDNENTAGYLRNKLVSFPYKEPTIERTLADNPNVEIRREIANLTKDTEVIEKLSNDPDVNVRENLCLNKNVPIDVVKKIYKNFSDRESGSAAKVKAFVIQRWYINGDYKTKITAHAAFARQFGF